eukprot:3572592-Prymnesium_polylepis.1
MRRVWHTDPGCDTICTEPNEAAHGEIAGFVTRRDFRRLFRVSAFAPPLRSCPSALRSASVPYRIVRDQSAHLAHSPHATEVLRAVGHEGHLLFVRLATRHKVCPSRPPARTEEIGQWDGGRILVPEQRVSLAPGEAAHGHGRAQSAR